MGFVPKVGINKNTAETTPFIDFVANQIGFPDVVPSLSAGLPSTRVSFSWAAHSSVVFVVSEALCLLRVVCVYCYGVCANLCAYGYIRMYVVYM